MSVEEICQAAISTACAECEVLLSEDQIVDCSRLAIAAALDLSREDMERLVALETRPYQPAAVTHFKPLAALEVIASFAEGIASIEFNHPEFAPFAVVHMVKALAELRAPLAHAEADLFYVIYRRSVAGEAMRSDCQKDFEDRSKRFPSTTNFAFDSALQRLDELGLVEQIGDSLFLKERVMLRNTLPLFE